MTVASTEHAPSATDIPAQTIPPDEMLPEDDQPFRGILMGIAAGLLMWLIIGAVIIIARYALILKG